MKFTAKTQSILYLDSSVIAGILFPNKINQGQDGIVQKSFKKGEYIYIANNAAEKIYIIDSGRVKIGTHSESGKEVIKDIIRDSEVFGELVLIGVETRRDFAQAMEDTELWEIDRSEITNLLKDRVDISTFFMQLMGARVLSLEQRLESMVFKDSNSRIVDFLVELVEKRGERVGYEFVVRKFITHQEIANLTATSRQTVTTVLNDLRTKNIITFDRRRLLVRDLDRLKSKFQAA